MVFNRNPYIVFDFNRYANKTSLQAAITAVKRPQGGGTHTHKALDETRKTLFQTKKGMRYKTSLSILVDTNTQKILFPI